MNFGSLGGWLPSFASFLKGSKIIKKIGKAFKPTKKKATLLAALKSIQLASTQAKETDENDSLFEFLNPTYWVKSILWWCKPDNINHILIFSIVLFTLYVIILKLNKYSILFRVNGIYALFTKITLFGSACVLFSQNLVGIIITSISFISMFILNEDLLELSSILSLGSICFNISYCFLNIFLSTFKPTKTY